MKNVIEFLQNYQKFGSQLKYRTAQLYLWELKRLNEEHPNESKLDQCLMMANIMDCYIAQTEDLMMFVYAMHNTQNNYQNLREILLRTFIKGNNDDATQKFYNELKQINNKAKLINYLGLPSIDILANKLNISKKDFGKMLQFIIHVIKITLDNRSQENILTLHNKMKHGSLIYFEPGSNKKISFIDVDKNYNLKASGSLSVNYNNAIIYVDDIQKSQIVVAQLIECLYVFFDENLDKMELPKKEKNSIKKSLNNSYFQ